MTPLLLTIAMAIGADEKSAAPALDGKWLIVYAEEGGRRNTTWEQRIATLKEDNLSYSKEGEERSLRFKIGAHQTVKATLVVGKEEGKPLSGVFIAGQDYLCVSLNADAAKKDGDDLKGSSGSFILILRRQR